MITFHKDGTLPQNNEIFVFGSNAAGRHGAGAAKIAVEKFGAIYGEGYASQGRSYAIPTKDKFLKTLPLEEIEKNIRWFRKLVNEPTTNRIFFVTRVGCGLAGYKDEQIAPMFRGCDNCSFAEQWKPFLS